MKHLDLKPVADTCKKMLYKGCLLVGLVAACGLTACSDDDENAAAPVFPELQTISCNAGETKEFTFEANTNWSLESSELWCKLVKDDVESYVLSGGAGTQTVSIRATDEGSTVDAASVAKLWLTMGEQRVAIGEVTRSAKGTELKIYDKGGNEITELTVGYNRPDTFMVKANFHFALTGLPDWVQLQGESLVGAANQEVTGALQVLMDDQNRFMYDYDKYPVTADEHYVVTFTDDAGKASFSFPVVYAGMDEMEVRKQFPEGTTHAYNWTVSLDGKTFVQGSSAGSSSSSSTAFNNRLDYQIKALNDKYVYLYGTPSGGTMNFSASSDWIHMTGDKGEVTLTADAGSEERTVYVLVFSQAAFDAFGGNYTEIWNGEDIAENYQNNLLIQLTQKNIVDSGNSGQLFGSVTDMMGIELESSLLNSGDRLSQYQSQYGVSAVLDVTIPSTTKSIFVALNLTLDTSANLVFHNAEGGNAPSGVGGEPYFSQGEDRPRLNVYGLENLEEEVLVIVTESSESGEGRKVMVVIHPASQSGGEAEGVFSITNAATGANMSCVGYAGSDESWLISHYGVESIWQVEKPDAGSLDVVLSDSGKTMVSWDCYDFTSEASISLSDEIMDINGDGSLINIWIGGAFVEHEVIFIVITDNTGAKYGLIIGTPIIF